jgi:hypothetical protein
LPGTPPTSPRFDAPRYADSDTASFSAQVNAVTDALDHAVKLTPISKSANYTAVDGDNVFCSGTITVTMPSSPAVGATVGVVAGGSIGSPAQVTVDPQSGGEIRAKSGQSLTSLPLCSFAAGVVLQCLDGTNWWVVAGEPDTGWLNMTIDSGNGFAGSAFGVPCQARQVGERVYLRGGFTSTSGSNVGSDQCATLPTGVAEPTREQFWPAVIWSSGGFSSASALLIAANSNEILFAGLVNNAQGVIFPEGAGYTVS